ncbi:tripartite tricarboxylate transporter TctB family protein [Thalassovita sp.]|jgi:hypothetical protein|uniref:tripartite tricarboxylate transporter TctB family protein n=1 Tax=Thalassovita sp. TaxID=1979401 RepID=UPI003B5988BB
MPFQNAHAPWERHLGSIALLVCAISVLAIGWSYPAGSITQMGPGFFPRIIGFLLLGFGTLSLISEFKTTSEAPGRVHWRNIGFTAASVLAFAGLIDKGGLVPATFVAVMLSKFADRDARPLDAAIYTSLVCLGAWLLFIQILGLPLAAFGRG